MGRILGQNNTSLPKKKANFAHIFFRAAERDPARAVDKATVRVVERDPVTAAERAPVRVVERDPVK